MKKAVALAYERYAPHIVASGKGEIAKGIIAKAREWDVPLFQNEALVESMITLKVNEEIPPQLYQAVVEVFLWLNQCEQNAQLSRD